MNGKADLGVFKAEDLLLASVINNQTVNDLVITNEFRFIPDRMHNLIDFWIILRLFSRFYKKIFVV